MAKRSFIAHEMGKNDMIGILIVALVTIVVGVYNVWCSIDILSYLSRGQFLFAMLPIVGMLNYLIFFWDGLM